MDRRQRANEWRQKHNNSELEEALTMTPDAAKRKFMLDVKQQATIDKAKESGDNVCVYWVAFPNKEKRVTRIEIEPRDAVKPIEGKTGTDTMSAKGKMI